MAERRDLSFARLEDVVAEVDRLLAGHVTVGRWSLGQICHHLSTGVRLLLLRRDGGLEPSTARPLPAAVRARFLRRDRFPDGVEAPLPVLLPPAGLDDRAEADTLRDAVTRFLAAPGPFPPHPYLGPLTKDEWVEFHRMHAAHHLGFAVPRTPADAADPDPGSKRSGPAGEGGAGMA